MGESTVKLMPLACVVIVVTATLSGCAGEVSGPAAGGDHGASGSGAAGAVALDGSIAFEDTAGHTYDLTFSVAASPYIATTAGAKAGKTNVTSAVGQYQLALENTTVGAEAPGLTIKVVSVYEESSMACELDGMPGPYRVNQGPYLAEITSGPNTGMRVCYVDRTRQLIVLKNAALPAGGSADLVPLVAAWSPTDPSTSTVPMHETAAVSALAALNAPLASVIVTSPLGGANTCIMKDDFEAGVTGEYGILDPSGAICG